MRPRSVMLAAVAVGAAGYRALPQLAERRLRRRLERNGTGVRVDVAASPATKLLQGRADRVDVRVAETRAGTGKLADLLVSTAAATELTAHVDLVHTSLLRLRDVTLTQTRGQLSATARVTRDDLVAALPFRANIDLRPETDPATGELLLVGEASLFGFAARAQARVVVDAGEVHIRGERLPFGLDELARTTVFADPRVEVLAVRAHERPDGFTLAVEARLRSPGASVVLAPAEAERQLRG